MRTLQLEKEIFMFVVSVEETEEEKKKVNITKQSNYFLQNQSHLVFLPSIVKKNTHS